MKQEIKKTNIFITLVLLVLAIVCVTNVTYSYFTATETKDDSGKFGNLNIQFVYMLGSTPNSETTSGGGKIELYSASGPIQRDVEFDLGVLVKNGNKESVTAIDEVAVKNFSDSCDCYARFWIDAYIVKDDVVDETINYGKYFFWKNNSMVYARSETSNYYYFVRPLAANDNVNYPINKTLKLQDVSTDDQVPVELLGEDLKIILNIQAVQKANGAYMEVFADDADHYDWENRKE